MKRFGFTLIELLVVLAIISLLAAIILPVLRVARMQAMTTRCRGNLGEIGRAMNYYATDNGEFLLNAGSSSWGNNNPGAGHIDWTTWGYTGSPTQPAPDLSDAVSSYTYDWFELYTPFTEGIEPFIDPGMKKPRAGFTQPGLTADGTVDADLKPLSQGEYSRLGTYRADYAPNLCLLNSWNDESKRFLPATLAQIKWADSVVAFQCERIGFDTAWHFMPNFSFSTELGSADFATSTDGGPNSVPRAGWVEHRFEGVERGKLIHRDKLNFLFIDGHVKTMAPEVKQRDWHFASAERHWELTRKYIEPEP